MTSVLPEPVPLPDPPGDPVVLGELIDGWSSAAFHVGVLASHLSGPAATAPGWRGRDADVAGAQVATATGVVRDVHDMLTAALDRLGRHREVLDWARTQVRALQGHQEDDLRAARIRLSQLAASTGLLSALATPPPEAAAVCEGLAAADEARRRAHARVLDDVAADALATVAELAGLGGVVGATGRPGDGARVTVRLAAVLPGWGAHQMAALGAELVSHLSIPLHPDEVEATVVEYLAYASDPDFAGALLSSLGPGRVQQLMVVLGDRAQTRSARSAPAEPPPDPMADLLGRVLGALERPGLAVPDVLDGVRVDPADLSSGADVVAAGMGAVLATGSVGPRVAHDWARQLIDRELATGRRSVDALRWTTGDPLPLALAVVARDPALSADLLTSPSIWPVAVARLWEDDGASLASVVQAAAHAPAAAADDATIRTLAGLAGALPDVIGELDDHPRAAAFVAVVSDAAASLVAARLDAVLLPVVSELGAVGEQAEHLSDGHVDALTGLGLVGLEPTARATVLTALTSWAVRDPLPSADTPQDQVAFAQGGVFAALASGEWRRRRLDLVADVRAAQSAQTVYAIVTWPLGVLKGVGTVASIAVPALEPDDATDRVLDEMYVQPETGPAAARWAAVAAAVPRLVRAGRLPHPGSSLGNGLDGQPADAYVASLDAVQRDVWVELVQGADAGFNAVGQRLGVIPGAPADARPDAGGR